MTDVFIRRKEERERRESCIDGTEVVMMQLTSPRTETGTTGTRKKQVKNFSLEPSEGVWPCHHFDFELVASRSTREYISAA
jgi:hypothetical protein